MKKLALVLGGGSAKGYAHIGVLKTLERHGIRPDLIVGTSMGALVGGMYASGVSIEDMEQQALKFNNIGSFSLISTLFKGNLINPDKVKKHLTNVLKDKTHADCSIDFVAMATEVKSGKEKALKSGLLRDNIMASIAIPGIFPTVEIDGKVYCDGGVTNNLPEDVARRMMPDAVVVSVDVIGPYEKQVETNKFKVVESLVNANTLLTQLIVRLKGKDADLRVEISQPEVSMMDYSKDSVALAINKGKNTFKHYIKQIKELLGEEHGVDNETKETITAQECDDCTARGELG